jgi:uncharacterized protein YecE (DUF72 family)
VIRIGISGWRYEPWRGVFYPEGLAQRRELEFCGQHFPSVEINGSFYSLQRPEYYEAWYRETPPGFVFAVKGSRYITHMLRLTGIEKPLANFYASGILNLKHKLGPFLWQFPEMFHFKPERLEAFFALLPRDTAQALSLARRRDARMIGRSRLAIDAVRPLRHAIEIRHPSFVHPEFLALLRKHRIGLVVADTAGKWPRMFDVTADFVYVRLHGDKVIYTSGYTRRALDQWAKRIRAWDRRGADVYVYFDNDVKVRAPYDAQALMRKLGLSWPAASALPEVAPSLLRLPSSLGPRARPRTIEEDGRWNFNARVPRGATSRGAIRSPSRTRTSGTPARR